MRQKKLAKSILSTVLAATMVFGSLGMTGFAKESKGAASGIPQAQTVAVPTQATGTTYYVDSAAAVGGTGTKSSPFKTLAEVNKKVLQPGDGISLKCGSVFDNQQLAPKGRGTQTSPILINTYGTGKMPVINAGGFRKTGNKNADNTPEYAGHKEAVLIENMEYVFVTGLEVTNDDDLTKEWESRQANKDRDYPRRLGIHVTIDERGRNNSYKGAERAYKSVVIDGCYIHNVDGNENRGVNKVDGGIGIEVISSTKAG
ncbi:MAG: hypothetical protein RSF88_02665, partial [Lachnospiraceae bacterium]